MVERETGIGKREREKAKRQTGAVKRESRRE